MDIPSAPAPSICQQCQEQVDLDFDFTIEKLGHPPNPSVDNSLPLHVP